MKILRQSLEGFLILRSPFNLLTENWNLVQYFPSRMMSYPTSFFWTPCYAEVIVETFSKTYRTQQITSSSLWNFYHIIPQMLLGSVCLNLNLVQYFPSQMSPLLCKGHCWNFCKLTKLPVQVVEFFSPYNCTDASQVGSSEFQEKLSWCWPNQVGL